MFIRSLFRKVTLPYRVHIDEKDAALNFADHILDLLPIQTNKNIVIVCIGTDRSTGDSLGPLIGSQLKQNNITSFHVYGTLEDPVHAVNLKDKMDDILDTYNNPFVIAIDACLGRSTSIGTISINDGPVKPGAAVNKVLPLVGNIHITGIVNVGGFMEYMVLQNTRLHLVFKIAQIITESLVITDKKLQKEQQKSHLKQNKSSFFSG